jgi:hypothetical protein
LNKILHYIDLGKKEGATLQCGGERIGDKGYFVQPTVFSDVTNDMKIARDEVSTETAGLTDSIKQPLNCYRAKFRPTPPWPLWDRDVPDINYPGSQIGSH